MTRLGMRGAVPPLPRITSSRAQGPLYCFKEIQMLIGATMFSRCFRCNWLYITFVRVPLYCELLRNIRLFFIFERYLDETKYVSVENTAYIFRVSINEPVLRTAGNHLPNYTVSQPKKGKGKVARGHGMEAYKGSRGIAPLIAVNLANNFRGRRGKIDHGLLGTLRSSHVRKRERNVLNHALIHTHRIPPPLSPQFLFAPLQLSSQKYYY